MGCKLDLRGGACFLKFNTMMHEIDAELAAVGDGFDSIRAQFCTQLDSLEAATGWMLRTGQSDPNAVLAGSSPYLRMWGLTVGGWLMERSALAGGATGDADQPGGSGRMPSRSLS